MRCSFTAEWNLFNCIPSINKLQLYVFFFAGISCDRLVIFKMAFSIFHLKNVYSSYFMWVDPSNFPEFMTKIIAIEFENLFFHAKKKNDCVFHLSSQFFRGCQMSLVCFDGMLYYIYLLVHNLSQSHFAKWKNWFIRCRKPHGNRACLGFHFYVSLPRFSVSHFDLLKIVRFSVSFESPPSHFNHAAEQYQSYFY